MLFKVVLQLPTWNINEKVFIFVVHPAFLRKFWKKLEVSLSFSEIYVEKNVKKKQDLDMDRWEEICLSDPIRSRFWGLDRWSDPIQKNWIDIRIG